VRDAKAHWESLRAHATRLAGRRTLELFQHDPQRASRLALRVGPIYADFAKQRVDGEVLVELLDLALAAALPHHVRALFDGEPVNRSEARPALHTALRAAPPEPGDESAAAVATRAAQAVHSRLAELIDEYSSTEGGNFTDLVHVGIGGSELGPRLVCEALGLTHHTHRRVHFLSNVDGHGLERLTRSLDPRHTLVCLVSKSFTTQETLLNGAALAEWLVDATGEGRAVLERRFIAVTANVEGAQQFGVATPHILPMWDWVGGRYSLWSAVGIPIAWACGMAAFRALLNGARAMDVHYQAAPPERNLPMLFALIAAWNREALGLPTQAVIPYDERLRLLPAYLQQLEMESNGKRVDERGEPVEQATAPVVWGDVGTNAQHAFFQALHQGTDIVPVDFVGVVRPAHAWSGNHQALLANLLAQSAALMRGTEALDARDPNSNHKACPGDRPNSVLLLDEITPESLGMLLALYEHKTHALGRLWRIDSFDQWGVELGKKIAGGMHLALGRREVPGDADASSRALLEEIAARREPR
jgi:glucose-6-phosphate isomerase